MGPQEPYVRAGAGPDVGLHHHKGDTDMNYDRLEQPGVIGCYYPTTDHPLDLAAATREGIGKAKQRRYSLLQAVTAFDRHLSPVRASGDDGTARRVERVWNDSGVASRAWDLCAL